MILPLLLFLAAPDDCENAVTQIEMTECAAQMFAVADAELNAVWPRAYAEVKSRGGADYAQALLTSQRAWIAYRDSQCLFASHGAGSGASMRQLTCKALLTNERTMVLRGIVEGD